MPVKSVAVDVQEILTGTCQDSEEVAAFYLRSKANEEKQ